jgi:GDP-L-fucose synthase
MSNNVLNLKDKRVLLTGGRGFLGQHIHRKLLERGAIVSAPTRKECDFREKDQVERLFAEFRPEVVIHGAVNGGGIGYMRTHGAEVFYDNLMMNTLLVDAAHRFGAEKFVGIGTICSYPKITPVPFREENLWDGYPEETNGPYGLSKKMMMVQTQAYYEQYGFVGTHLLLVNMYGPGDDFSDETSHVIPAMIKRFMHAKETGAPSVVCWGDGSPTREFLYVEDAAEGILLSAERYTKPDPVNLGIGEEISIKDLATLIARHVGYEGAIEWDTTKPNGQPRRCLDTERAAEEFGFRASTSFEAGLAQTIEWYKNANREEVLR